MDRAIRAKIEKIKEVYGAFHARFKDIIRKQSDLIERIGKHSDEKMIEEVRNKIKNL